MRTLLLLFALAVPSLSWGQATHPTKAIEVPPSYVAGKVAVPDLDKTVREFQAALAGFRKEEGQPALKTNKTLTEAAQAFADYMAANDRYGHQADDREPHERTKKAGYDHCLVLENIAYQYNSDGFRAEQLAEGFFQGWKKSPGHRKNMLDPDATEAGAGLAFSKNTGHFYAVQLFGRPRSDSFEFSFLNATKGPVEYKLGERKFTLPAGFTRTHQECRPEEVTVGKERLALKSGTTYRIGLDDGGALKVEAAGPK